MELSLSWLEGSCHGEGAQRKEWVALWKSRLRQWHQVLTPDENSEGVAEKLRILENFVTEALLTKYMCLYKLKRKGYGMSAFALKYLVCLFNKQEVGNSWMKEIEKERTGICHSREKSSTLDHITMEFFFTRCQSIKISKFVLWLSLSKVNGDSIPHHATKEVSKLFSGSDLMVLTCEMGRWWKKSPAR